MFSLPLLPFIAALLLFLSRNANLQSQVQGVYDFFMYRLALENKKLVLHLFVPLLHDLEFYLRG